MPIIGPHKADKSWLDELPALAERFGLPGAKSFTPDRWLEEGDVVEVAGGELHVYHCPGHTLGHVVFHIPADKTALVGDVLFKGSIGRTDLPGGNITAMSPMRRWRADYSAASYWLRPVRYSSNLGFASSRL